MNWFHQLFFVDSVAHSILILSIVVAVGIICSKIRIKGFSLGVAWILFVGIALSHFGLRVNEEVLHIFKEFGLILFVYSIGLQVGPAFFSSFKKGGLQLNLLAVAIVLTGCLITYAIYRFAEIPMPTMVGIMSGAVTNTPGLGAAQQTALDITGISNPDIATGYAVAYPLGVVGIILTIILLRRIFRVDLHHEEEQAIETDSQKDSAAQQLSLRVTNKALDGMRVGDIHDMTHRNFVISRMRNEEGVVKMVNADTVLHLGYDILVITSQAAVREITALIGESTSLKWKELNTQLISRRILVTKSEYNGASLSQLRLRSLGVSITRVNRSGIDLVATPALQVQVGDRVTVVGTQNGIAEVEKKLGNSLKRLDHPNLFTIFVGIVAGVILGSIPFNIPGVPQAIKLGLAGGPLIVAILISRIGPRLRLVTYTTMSANLMLREVGIALFLACVGLGAGETFIDTIINGGYQWVAYGAMITIVPIFLIGYLGRKFLKLNFLTLSGLIAGSMTDPPALAYANDMSGNDIPAISYATVYPLTMFMRVLCAQLMILLF